MCSSATPSPNAAWENLRRPMPLGRKLELIARNIGIRVTKRQTCCGHPGEPGC
jgi:hypothetical protein